MEKPSRYNRKKAFFSEEKRQKTFSSLLRNCARRSAQFWSIEIMFSVILIDTTESGQTVERTRPEEDRLPDGGVSIDVAFSSLNYKDGLAITCKSPVVRTFPMVPGIDLAGTVTHSPHADCTAILNLGSYRYR